MSTISKTRWGVAVGVPAAMVLSVMAFVPAGTAGAAPAAAGKTQNSAGTDTIVGLGDSYMSGEGALITNHNFPGNDPGCTSSDYQTAAGSVGNAVGCGVIASYMYDAKKVNGAYVITPSTDTGNGARTFRSIFGDANGWPDSTPASNPQGVESTPYCDRSFSAEPIIGNGWVTKNLACSGATQPNQVKTDKAYEGIFSKPAFNYAKPGITFKTMSVDAPFPQGFGTVPGQAQSLQDFATSNKDIEVVALSIGGNDFGFGEIGKTCITDGTTGGRCETEQKTQDLVKAGIPKARDAVRTSIENIVQAMRTAGYEDGSWKLVYQNPPLPVAKGADTKWDWSAGGGTRGSVGGCGLADSTLDWVVTDLYPQLTQAMQRGLLQARDTLGDTQVVQIDTTKTFEGHRLCEKGTIGATNYQAKQASRTPPWQDDNGKGTEWITYVSRTAALFGNVYQAAMPLHPNYWGQRALAACMAKAIEVTGSASAGCVQDDGEALNAQGQPEMNLIGITPLWINVTGTPVIEGVPNVGQTLTADNDGIFSPDADYTFSYQWLGDGVEIAGATDKQYTVAASDLGKDLQVRVRGSVGELSADAVSDPVSVSDIIVVDAPVISGPTQVGATLTISSGTYNITPDSIAYQWLVDGEEIDGATTSTFAIRPADLGRSISARVLVTKASFQDLQLNASEVGPVTQGTLTVTGKPTISGELVVGKALTAGIAGVTFSQPTDRVAYRWYRNGDLVEGVETPTYELSGDDLGQRISVAIVGYKEGYGSAASDRAEDTGAISRGVITQVGKPRIQYGSSNGVTPLKVKNKKVRYGLPLEADIWDVFSEWPAPAEVTWFRKKNGKVAKIKSAEDDYGWSPRLRDIGSKVRVSIQTANEGFVEASATTAWYKVIKGKHVPVKAPRIAIVTKAQATRAKVGVPLVSSRAVFLPPTRDVQYQWMRGSSTIKGADARRYVPSAKDVGKELRVKAYVPASRGFEYSQVLSKPTKPVKAVKGLG